VIAWPAIDLRGGRVVQLVGGDPARTAVDLPDPSAVARRFEAAGFAGLHVVDLDAALGEGDNREAIAALIGGAGVPVQVGGGLRDAAAVAWALAAGAARAIVGTRAVRDRAWLEAMVAAHPDRLVVAADCRDGLLLTHGWRAAEGLPVADFVAGLAGLPLAAVLVTDVGREGRLAGADVALFAALAARSSQPLIAAGGIATAADLAALADAGVAGAVLGMALYTGALDAPAVISRNGARRTRAVAKEPAS
jgi:phosphoribosylformimino-5-aminoimidazole carboxamide ribotide isomerase